MAAALKDVPQEEIFQHKEEQKTVSVADETDTEQGSAGLSTRLKAPNYRKCPGWKPRPPASSNSDKPKSAASGIAMTMTMTIARMAATMMMKNSHPHQKSLPQRQTNVPARLLNPKTNRIFREVINTADC